MPNKNRVELEGYVSDSPEMKYSKEGTEILSFDLATNNHYEKNGVEHSTVDYHKIVMFKKMANKFYGEIKKGMNISIEGRIKYNKWQKPDGNIVYYTQIIAHRCHIISNLYKEE